MLLNLAIEIGETLMNFLARSNKIFFFLSWDSHRSKYLERTFSDRNFRL